MRTIAGIFIAVVIIILITAAIIRSKRVRKFRKSLHPGIMCHYYVNEERYLGTIEKVYEDENEVLVKSETGVYSYVSRYDIYP